MADEKDRARLDEVHPPHGIACLKDELTGRELELLAPDILQMRNERLGHDIHHVVEWLGVASVIAIAAIFFGGLPCATS